MAFPSKTKILGTLNLTVMLTLTLIVTLTLTHYLILLLNLLLPAIFTVITSVPNGGFGRGLSACGAV